MFTTSRPKTENLPLPPRTCTCMRMLLVARVCCRGAVTVGAAAAPPFWTTFCSAILWYTPRVSRPCLFGRSRSPTIVCRRDRGSPSSSPPLSLTRSSRHVTSSINAAARQHVLHQIGHLYEPPLDIGHSCKYWIFFVGSFYKPAYKLLLSRK